MKNFCTKIDRRNKREMCDFLSSHPRYWTMNSWNSSNSYAHCVKVHSLGLPSSLIDKAYEILDVRETYWRLEDVMDEFGRSYGHRYQMSWNGRSGGYVVMVNGGEKETTYKTRCDMCMMCTWYEGEQPCKADGCMGTLIPLKKSPVSIYTQPGLDIDQDGIGNPEYYMEWMMFEVKDRVDLVQDFDNHVQQMAEAFVSMCKRCEIVDSITMVEKHTKVLKCDQEI